MEVVKNEKHVCRGGNTPTFVVQMTNNYGLVYLPAPEQSWKLVVLPHVAVKDRVAVDVEVEVTVEVP